MSISIGIDEAQAKLKDIIAALGPDDEVVITDQNRPIARILRTSKPQPQFGSCKGMLTIDDVDWYLAFAEFKLVVEPGGFQRLPELSQFRIDSQDGVEKMGEAHDLRRT